jgi:hypothetical protein
MPLAELLARYGYVLDDNGSAGGDKAVQSRADATARMDTQPVAPDLQTDTIGAKSLKQSSFEELVRPAHGHAGEEHPGSVYDTVLSMPGMVQALLRHSQSLCA